MDIKFVLSIIVSISSLGLVLVGLPAQILKNYREKRSGQPLLTILIALGFYLSQIVFFYLSESFLPIISFTIGTIMWGIVLFQYFIYRDR
ncbi:MAG: hypothetical protein Q8P07_01325 [bacterium]|nr:hypothetical protein [bacterium]